MEWWLRLVGPGCSMNFTAIVFLIRLLAVNPQGISVCDSQTLERAHY